MFTNDNRFEIQSIDYTSEHTYISEGVVVGIAVGWIVGVIGLYILVTINNHNHQNMK